MARIELKIDADNAGDLMQTLADLASFAPADAFDRPNDVDFAVGDRITSEGVGGFPETAEVTSTAKRTRRTKAQIATDEANAAAKAAGGPFAETAGAPNAGNEPASSGSATGVFGDFQEGTSSPPASAPPSNGGATKEAMMAAIQQHLAKGSPAKTQELIVKITNGATRMSEIPEQYWGAVTDAINADL